MLLCCDAVSVAVFVLVPVTAWDGVESSSDLRGWLVFLLMELLVPSQKSPLEEPVLYLIGLSAVGSKAIDPVKHNQFHAMELSWV